MTVPPNTPDPPPASPPGAVAPEPRQLDRRYISGCVAGLLLGGALGVPGAYALLRSSAEARPCAQGLSPEERAQKLDAGVRALSQRDPARALDIFRELRRAAPEDPVVHNNICVALNELHHYAEAEASCKDALALDPGYARARNNLAWAQAQRVKAGTGVTSSR